MRKLLSILIIGLLFAVNIQAGWPKFNSGRNGGLDFKQKANYSEKDRFEKDGTCRECDGKGTIENREYTKNKMGSKEFFKCIFCKGTGKKPRKIDGKLLITKNRRRYKNYTIKHVDDSGIAIIYQYGLGTKEALIKSKYWPEHLQKQIDQWEKNNTKPSRDVILQCPKCEKKFVHTLDKNTTTRIRRISLNSKCPQCGKKRTYTINNPLYKAPGRVRYSKGYKF